MSSATANCPSQITHIAEEVELEFIDFDHNPTTEEILARFKEQRLDRPKAKDAPEFRAELSDQGEGTFFVFLQEEELRDPHGIPSALIVRRDASRRELWLKPLDNRWSEHCRFVARRRKS